MPLPEKRSALILSAGGARAAYQVGVLKYLAQSFPRFQPQVFTGISAGSINACYLAQGTSFDEAARHLFDRWYHLEFDHVFKTNFSSVISMLLRWGSDMFVSKVTRKLLMKSLLDAAPLSRTLFNEIRFSRIAGAIRDGSVRGLAIITTNYHNGQTSIFYDSTDPISPWIRQDRRAIKTKIRVRHVMASCSIPILFEPVRIGNYLYGDGALRYSYPFSPSIHLGATHVFAVSIRCANPVNVLGFRPENVSLGFVAGAVLNSIFLDSLEQDYENLQRINRISSGTEARRVNALMIRPSQDLGSMSREFLKEIPFSLRQLVGSAASPQESGDLVSYLLFSPKYLRALLDLGMKDAAAHHSSIQAFVESTVA